MTRLEQLSGLRGAKADPNCRLCGGRGVLMKPETRPCLCLLDSVSSTMGLQPEEEHIISLRDIEMSEDEEPTGAQRDMLERERAKLARLPPSEEDDGQPDEQQEWRDACGDEDDWMSGAEQVEDAP